MHDRDAQDAVTLDDPVPQPQGDDETGQLAGSIGVARSGLCRRLRLSLGHIVRRTAGGEKNGNERRDRQTNVHGFAPLRESMFELRRQYRQFRSSIRRTGGVLPGTQSAR